jgi:WD40 repeat protein
MNEAKVGFSMRALDLFFGYDYFLVHRSADGKKYASALYEALTGKGNELDCFLDVKHYGAGENLTSMQARALRKTSRLIVIVTPRAHEVDAIHVQNEVNEFRRIHPNRIIAPIGTWQTLSENGYSPLLPLLPHLPNDICILETPEQMEEGTPSPQTIAKLLNDFAEERRSTKRLRWIRRVALLLLVFLLAAIGFAFYAAREASEAKRQLQVATAQRLAAEATNLRDYRPSLLELATLLSAEACKRSPAVQTREALRLAVTLLASRDHALDDQHAIRSAVFSPDGTLCATGREDGQIGVWNTFAGTRRGPQIPWTENGGVLALDNRGQIAVADGLTIRVRDLDQMRERMIHDPCTGSVFSIGLSALGRYLYALSHVRWGEPSDLCVWELKDEEPVLKIRVKGSGGTYPDSVVFSPTESHLAIKPLNGMPEIWNLDTGRQAPPLGSEITSVVSTAFSDDGRQFAAGDFSGTILVWNVEDGKNTAHFKCSWAGTALAFSHDGNRLAAGSESEVRVWRIPSGDEILSLPHGTVVNNVLFSPDDRFLLTHSQDGTLRVWKTKARVEVNRLPLGTTQNGRTACFSPDSRLVAVQSGPNRIQICSIGQGDINCQVEEGTGAGAAALAAGNHYLATTSPGDETLRVWKIDGSSCVKSFEGKGGGKIAFSPQANYVAASENGYSSTGDLGTVMVWVYEVATGNEIAAIKHEVTVPGTGLVKAGEPPRFPDISITSLAFSPEGNRLTTESSDGTVRVTHLPDGRKEFEKKLTWGASMVAFAGPDQLTLVDSVGNVLALSLSSEKLSVVAHYDKDKAPLSLSQDGRFLATIGKDSQVQIQDLNNYRGVFQFQSRTNDDLGAGNPLPIQAAAFSRDGHYLAASQYANDSRYTTVTVWDLVERLEVARMVLNQPAAGISFSQDSRYLVSAGAPTVVRLWQDDDLLRIARQRISRNLTQDEWSIFIGNEPYRKTFKDLP